MRLLADHSEIVERFMRRNPCHGYGYACGYVAGQAALNAGNQFAGLSQTEWQHATDDYAHGYRAAFTHDTEAGQ